MVRLGFTEKVIFEQKLEEDEGISHVGVWARARLAEDTTVSKSYEGSLPGMFEEQQRNQFDWNGVREEVRDLII